MTEAGSTTERPALQDAMPTVTGFFRWWGQELADMIPGPTRRLLDPDYQIIAIDLGSGEARWFRSKNENAGDGEVLGPLPLAEDAAAAGRELRTLVKSRPRGRRAMALILPEALTRTVTLPAAAGRNLRAVLRLDMDRQTPFPGAEVRFTYHRLPSEPTDETIKVALTFAPLQACERAERLATKLGYELAYLGAGSGPPWRDSLVQKQGGWRSWAINALLGLIMILAAAALWLPIERDRRAAAAAGAEVAALQARHEALITKQADLAGTVTAAAAIAAEPSPALPMLDDLTQALPAETRIDRLAWRGGEVVISGRTPSAAALVSALSAVPAFRAVTYRSPVTRAGSGEKFHLAFEFGTPKGEP